jgi:hypothetical protein
MPKREADTPYSEPEKMLARQRALQYAVELLTKNRDEAAIVPENYIERVHSILMAGEYNRRHVNLFNQQIVGAWQQLRSGVIGTKTPRDLTVAYLAGPEPLNDFRELVNLGVHPYNIWAFENEEAAFQAGLERVKQSEFPLLKLHKGSIDSFLQSVPRAFDLIYIDACGPLPSREQKTLRTLANIFRCARLSSPGVLITNFACPDVNDAKQVDDYSSLISTYLWPKPFLESGKHNWNMDDGAAAHGILPMRCEDQPYFPDVVKGQFEFYYGQYITRQIFDLASFIAPWTRFVNSEIWSSLFTAKPKDVALRAHKLQHFDEGQGGGNFIVDPDMAPIGWSISAFLNTGDTNYPVADPSNKLIQSWKDQLSGSPPPSVDAMTATLAYDVLRMARISQTSESGSLFTPALSEVMEEFGYIRQMPVFCDVPTEVLAFYPILSQYMLPSIYNTELTRRYSYVARGKKTRMFLDIIPFDNCRYVFDWLPTPHLVGGSFAFLSQQLVYRYVLDALAKNCMRYNTEYLLGANVVGVNEDGFTEKLLSVRQAL